MIKEIQIKATQCRFHLSDWQRLKGLIISTAGKDVVKCLCSYVFGGDIN